MYMCFDCVMYVYYVIALRPQRPIRSPETGVMLVANHNKIAANRTWVPWKSSQCSSEPFLQHSLSPLDIFKEYTLQEAGRSKLRYNSGETTLLGGSYN